LSLSIEKRPTKRQPRVPEQTRPGGPALAWSGPQAHGLQDVEGGLLALALRVGLQTLQQMLAEEVDALVGPKGQHNPSRTAVRHGVEDGYVYVGERKVPVSRPRVRTTGGDEVPLTTYQAFQDPTMASQAVLERMLFGLASRQQPHANPALDVASGTRPASKSTISRQFIRATRQALDAFTGRRLDDRTWVVLMIDGIHVGGHVVVTALGIDAAGHKQILGLAEGATENHAVVTSLLTDLVERGLAIPQGALAVIDGAKALVKALHAVFGTTVTIQRCILHKQRNVLDHIADSDQARIRQRLRKAYQEPTAPAALAALRAALLPLGASIWDGSGENPYFGLLALADLILVTEESVSMISEAVATTAPVMLLKLPGRSRRQRLFAESLLAAGRVRRFAGRLDLWPVTPLDDTAEAAAEMRRRLGL